MAKFILALVFVLALASAVGAVDRLPIGGTIPDAPEPWRQLTYCPVHALEGFGDGR